MPKSNPFFQLNLSFAQFLLSFTISKKLLLSVSLCESVNALKDLA